MASNNTLGTDPIYSILDSVQDVAGSQLLTHDLHNAVLLAAYDIECPIVYGSSCAVLATCSLVMVTTVGLAAVGNLTTPMHSMPGSALAAICRLVPVDNGCTNTICSAWW